MHGVHILCLFSMGTGFMMKKYNVMPVFYDLVYGFNAYIYMIWLFFCIYRRQLDTEKEQE